MSFNLELEKIRESQTKEYMREVITSYEMGNYRSAVVMLYSVVMVDLMLKLVELADVYKNEEAQRLLNEVRSMSRHDPNREKVLLSFVKGSTEILSNKAIAEVDHLKNLRNISAHPDFDPLQKDILAHPDKYTVAGLINVFIADLFSISPYLGKNLFSFLLEEVEKNKEFYTVFSNKINDELFEAYLEERFFKHVKPELFGYFVEQIFKIVFVSTDEQAMANFDINSCILIFLYRRDKSQFVTVISESKHISNVNYHYSHRYYFIMALLFKEPSLYSQISNDLKVKIEQDTDLNITKYFVEKSSLGSYFESLGDSDFYYSNGDEKVLNVTSFQEFMKENNLLPELLKIASKVYVESENYNTADYRFRNWIQPLIDLMTVSDIENLAEEAQRNGQTIARNAAGSDHDMLFDRLKELLVNQETELNKIIQKYPRFFRYQNLFN